MALLSRLNRSANTGLVAALLTGAIITFAILAAGASVAPIAV